MIYDRSKKKKEKKANETLLKEQGMLPSEKFNYKQVDFSSFQGGSMENNVMQTKFQQPKVSGYKISSISTYNQCNLCINF